MSDSDLSGEPTEPRRYGLRKRKRAASIREKEAGQLGSLLELAERVERIVVFSGSGLSATSGMSTFSTRGGLYERAQRQFRLADGKALFTYSFFDRQRQAAQAFFADIYLEALRAAPAAGHHALAALDEEGLLRRHYTLNIDGLAEECGMETWHLEQAPGGVTVEMHGNVRRLVCPACHVTLPMTAALARALKAQQPVPCPSPGCGNAAMRFKVMMYEDAEGECITPDEVMDLMEEDVQAADLILWVGISFQQSASTQYFKKVRHWLQAVGRVEAVPQVVINPSDDAYFNLISACCNQADLAGSVLPVQADADDVLPRLATAAARGAARRHGGGRPVRVPAKQQQQQQQQHEEQQQLPVAVQQQITAAAVPMTEQQQQQQQQPVPVAQQPRAQQHELRCDARAEHEQLPAPVPDPAAHTTPLLGARQEHASKRQQQLAGDLPSGSGSASCQAAAADPVLPTPREGSVVSETVASVFPAAATAVATAMAEPAPGVA